MADENEIRSKDLPSAATEADLVAGNYIALDCDVTKKLEVPTLLNVTAQNALAGNVAPAFDPNVTNAIAGMLYVYGGELYMAREDYSGAWNASKFTSISIDNFLKNVKYDDVCFTFGNIVDVSDADVAIGKYLNRWGALNDTSSYNTTGFIKAHQSTTYYSVRKFYCILAYDKDKNILAYDDTHNATQFTTPLKTEFIRFSIDTAFWDSVAVSANKPVFNRLENHALNDIRIPREFVEDAFLRKMDYQSIPFFMLNGFTGGNIKDFIVTKKAGYYIAQTGSIVRFAANASYNTIVLPVPKGYTGKVSFSSSARFVCMCDRNGVIDGGNISESTTSIDVVDNGDFQYFVATFLSGVDLNNIIITLGSVPSNDVVLPAWLGIDSIKSEIVQIQSDIGSLNIDTNPKSLSVFAASPSVGDSLYIDDALCEAKKVQTITFAGTLNGALVDLKVGWMNSSGVFGYGIKITPSEIIPVSNGTEGAAKTSGLAIADNLQVKIINKTSYIGFEITSCGEKIDYTSFPNFLHSPNAQCKPCVIIDSPMVDCKLSWTLQKMDAKILVMGDSYCGMNDPSRWPTLLSTDGYDAKTVVNAYSGEGSSSAVVSLENLLKTMKPKYIVWCLGMNDSSDSSSEPSANWVTGRDNFLAQCEACGAEPVFGTIPTVPSVNNEKKNEWIRASGKRFIDFAKAVGANSSGVWYTGMLSTDNVHPTEKGAKALYAQALTDFPEFLIT